MGTTTGISASTAAQLSAAAYAPWSSVAAGAVSNLPAEWKALPPPYSGQDAGGNNQFVSFFNAQTNQVVMAFRGSENLSNWKSDFANSGAAEWDSIKAGAQAAFSNIQRDYSGAEIMTDGHSLGGGMAQTFALANSLSGYGQNSFLGVEANAFGGARCFRG